MSHTSLALWASLLLYISSFSLGCTPAYVRGTQIDYSAEKEEVAIFIERYRVALEQRDIDTLKELVSERYYENGSTTNDPSDDYDYKGLEILLEKVTQKVKAIKYALKIVDIKILQDSAAVDVEYKGQYLFTHNEQDRWATYADKNRLTLKKDKEGTWKIVSGL